MRRPETPDNLYAQFGVRKPPHLTSHGHYGSLLVGGGIIRPEEAQACSPIFILSTFITVFSENAKRMIPETRRANSHLRLQENPDILADLDLKREIETLFTETPIQKDVGCDDNDTDLESHKTTAIALKLALDYAEGRHPKINFSDHPDDFIPVLLGNHAEIVIARTIEILEDAANSGEDISKFLELLEKLAPHVWRSTIKQALRNAGLLLPLLRGSEYQKPMILVVPGTNTPITEWTELAAVQSYISAAEDRIGESRIADLKAEFEKLKKGEQ